MKNKPHNSPETLISLEDYLISEEHAAYKSEYRHGEVVAMSGVTPKHDLIVNNLITYLNICLRKKGCKLFAKDVLLYVSGCEDVYYPNIFVICGKIKQIKRRSCFA